MTASTAIRHPQRPATRHSDPGRRRAANGKAGIEPQRTSNPDAGAPCSQSRPSSKATIASVRSFSTNSRPALRAACGRPPAGDDTTGTGAPASPSPFLVSVASGEEPRRSRRVARRGTSCQPPPTETSSTCRSATSAALPTPAETHRVVLLQEPGSGRRLPIFIGVDGPKAPPRLTPARATPSRLPWSSGARPSRPGRRRNHRGRRDRGRKGSLPSIAKRPSAPKPSSTE
jgi:hypothetical protein